MCSQFADSIEQFGFTNPVLIDEGRVILAGRGRVEAVRFLGVRDVSCLRLDHMTETEKRACVLADNKLALNTGWDEDLLAAEFGALLSDDLDFDIGLTEFSIPQIVGLMETVAPEEDGYPNDDLAPETASRRARKGDIWQLGRHSLICGDALDPQVVGDQMADEQAGWCSRIYRTTCQSTVMWAIPVRSSTGSLSWRPARCLRLRLSSLAFSSGLSVIWRIMLPMDRSHSFGWTGATWVRFWRWGRVFTMR